MPPPVTLKDGLIQKVVHLTQFRNSDEGRKIMLKVAHRLKPILKAHGWKVGMLSEFLPSDRGLLGLNTGMGFTIHIRLRHGWDHNEFWPFEGIMDTALHEICHNTFGPHDRDFHKMWDQARDEYFQYEVSGYYERGANMVGRGYVLGGKKISRQEARRVARAERAKLKPKALLAINQRLGGSYRPPRNRSQMSDRVATAAEARMAKTCATGRRTPERKKLMDQAAETGKSELDEDDVNELAIAQAMLELEQEAREEEATVQFGGSGRTHAEPMVIPDSPSRTKVKPFWDTMVEEEDSWECSECTLLNQTADTVCSLCETKRQAGSGTFSLPGASPKDDPPKKQTFCDTMVEKDDRWVCAGCTLLNQPVDSKCAVCGWERPVVSGLSPAKSASVKDDLTKTQPFWDTMIDHDDSWKCSACTLLNQPGHLICDACGVEKSESQNKTYARIQQEPKPFLVDGIGSHAKLKHPQHKRAIDMLKSIEVKERQKTWNCRQCTKEMEHTYWTCSACGLMKDKS